MIAPDARVRLAPKARLQRDRLSGKAFLLYPEREEKALVAIVDELTAASGEPRERIESEVLSFLRALDERGLLVVT